MVHLLVSRRFFCMETGIDRIWRWFFQDPTQWWDNRSKKHESTSWKFTGDFKHVESKEELFVRNAPEWAQRKLLAIADVPFTSRGVRASFDHSKLKEQLDLPASGPTKVPEAAPIRMIQAPAAAQGKAQALPASHVPISTPPRPVSEAELLVAVRDATTQRDLNKAEISYSKAVQGGHMRSKFVSTAILNMYAKCRSMERAKQVFDMIQNPDVVAYNALLAGYQLNGDYHRAWDYFQWMESSGVRVNARTYYTALKALVGDANGNPEDVQSKATELYKEIVQTSRLLSTDVYIGTVLVELFSKARSMDRAKEVFDSIPETIRNVVLYSTLMFGFIENGRAEEALDVFNSMQVTRDSRSYVAAIMACGRLGRHDTGSRLYAEASKRGVNDIYVKNALLDMYARCGDLSNAEKTLQEIKAAGQLTVVAYNSLLAHAKHKDMILRFYIEMKQSSGVAPNRATFVLALKACAVMLALDRGRAIHGDCKVAGLENDPVIAACLIEFYGCIGSLEDARKVFDKLNEDKRNVVVWNSLLGAYSWQDDVHVLELLKLMKSSGVKPDEISYVEALKVCSSKLLRESAECIMEEMAKSGLKITKYHICCLVELYGNLGDFDKAMDVIQALDSDKENEVDIPIWRSLLQAAQRHNKVHLAQLAYNKLKDDSAGKRIMSNFLGRHGFWEEAAEARLDSNYEASTWVWSEKLGRAVYFKVGQSTQAIRQRMESYKLCGYVPAVNVVSLNVPHDEKESILLSHCEKLAVVHSILHSSFDNKTLRLAGNLQICEDCHNFLAFVTLMEGIEISYRDTKTLHKFSQGRCSCASPHGKTGTSLHYRLINNSAYAEEAQLENLV